MNADFICFKDVLEKKGYKLTTKKQIILRTIFDNKIHQTSKQIYEKVKANNIALTTVYRALTIFKELGIVKEIDINRISYYEMKIISENPIHIHFQCHKCNNIIDINSNSSNVEYLNSSKKIEMDNNFQIYDSNIIFVGLCSKCKEKTKQNKRRL
ncbi:Fur family transcriptional regulator [Clostridium lacusfryxellense]|uniref:Fur family transcriptional regulator n=1 Tax=Clostridium lacusfryxellense TaxID=205328 RepID=UPI001C0C7A24|nr:transcriptional repressor [Clostridium lacusfryxellense]MBU3114508.1 transcriptional repressor [Clostridium lacusfryxellense]